MIIEYIIDGDEYKKFLKDIDFTASNGLTISKRNNRMNGKENFLLRLTSKWDDAEGAKALSEINNRIYKMLKDKKFKYRLLFNEASQYYAKTLYPLACEFETKLRKFIQSALFDLNEEAKNEVLGKLKKQKIIKEANEDLLNCNFLEYTELGGIISFLFANDDLYRAIDDFSKTPDNRCVSKDDLITFIKTCNKTSIWEQFFKDSFDDSILPERIQQVKDLRNDIMHFHEMDFEYYEKTRKIFDEVIRDLNKQIKKGIVLEVSEESKEMLANNPQYFEVITKTLSFIEKIPYEKIISNLQRSLDWYSKISTNLIEKIEKTYTYYDNLPKIPNWLLTQDIDNNIDKNNEDADNSDKEDDQK